MASSPKAMSSSSSNKKKNPGFLSRHKRKSKDIITEEELLKKNPITPEDVLQLTTSTESVFFECCFEYVKYFIQLWRRVK